MLAVLIPKKALPATAILGVFLATATLFYIGTQSNKETPNLPLAFAEVSAANTPIEATENTGEATKNDGEKPVSDYELSLLAQVVYAESRGEPFIGQVAVAAVILNRLQHPDFPGTIHGVIFEPRAFCSVATGLPEHKIPPLIKKAVRVALSGVDPTGGALYFYNPDTARCRWIRTRERIAVISRHVFAR